MSMKNLLDKMTQLSKLDETPKQPKKKVLKESAQVAPAKPSSLRELFNQLDEAMAPGQKPLPVLDPQNKQAGAGFVTSTNPAVQNMLKNLDPKDVQIVQAPGKPGMAPAAPAAAGGTGQAMGAGQAMKEDELDEKWAGDAKIKSTGQYAGKSVAELKSALSKLKASGPHSEGTPENKRMKQLMFAIRAKKDWKGGIEEGDLPSSSGVDNRGAGLGAGRSQSTFESKEELHKFKVCYTTTTDKEEETTISAASLEEATKKIKKKHNFKSLDSIKRVKPEKKEEKKEEKKSVKEGTKGVNPFAKKDDKAPAKAPAKGKKPDFLDLDKDGDKKEPMKKAASDKKKTVKEADKDIPYDDPEMVKGREIQAYLHKEQAAKKAAADKKAAAEKKKKTVKESMSHRMQAARLEGKAHGLKGHAYHGKHYEDMEEARCYHEGYKEGIDECYGMKPGMGLVDEAGMPPATTDGMASQAMEDEFMEDEFEEGNAFTAALAKTPKGGKFKVAGNTFTDTSGYDAKLDEYTFESLDSQLTALLNEGISVSISKDQENAPDSVTITAQDQAADELLSLVRNAGMGGIFGGGEEEAGSFAMPHAPEIGGASEINAPGDIEVVDDHDGMLALMRKFAGVQSSGPSQEVGPQEAEPEEYDNNQGDMLSLMNKMSGDEEGSDDYEDEEGDAEDYDSEDDSEKVDEEECNECGMMESKCCCDSDDKEVVDEVESEDQQEFEVAEANAPDTGADNTNADVAGQVGADNALAKADAGEDIEDGMKDQAVQESDEIEEDDLEEEELTEWANDAGGNGTETTFEQDIDFMTRVISGGLNKQKSTGQTTIPVIPGQKDRMGYSAMNESINDWAKLAGIKKN